MIERRLLRNVLVGLDETPSVCLLGARQVGKTTLALIIAAQRNALYLDLESPRDRAKLDDPEGYLEQHLDRLVILDEVHRVPDLFPILRGLIDRARRRGLRTGRYLLLGSAAVSLLRQAGESLAGRVRFLELLPLDALETADLPLDRLWLRGGFPESLLAENGEQSLRWREDFIRTYLERDIPQFGPRVPAETLRRLLVMLAHRHGSPHNAAELGRNLGLDARTVNSYVDLLVDLFLLRRLPPWHANVGKRLVKSPRLFLRDSGLVHALLGIDALDDLLAHPIIGASWEGFAIENLLSVAPEGTTAHYYRTSGGAEIDLLMELPQSARWAVEIKRSTAPAASRGFHEACADLEPQRRLIVYPGTERFPLAQGVEAVPLPTLAGELALMRRRS